MTEVAYLGHKVVPIIDFSDLDGNDQTEALIRYGECQGEDFFYYRGSFYSPLDFELTCDPNWDGKLSETFFSCVMVKFGENRYGDKIANVAVLCV